MTRAALIALVVALAACGPGGLAGEWSEAEREAILRLELREDVAPRPDATNRFTGDAAAARLGQALFFDASFSADARTSCATCHSPEKDFTDGRPVAEGVFPGSRNTPTIIGATLSTWLFWDGRKDSAWSQALGPIENPIEHAFTRVELVRVLRARHGAAYEAIFGALPPMDDARFPAKAKPDPADPGGELHRAWLAMSEEDRAAVNRAFSNFGKAIAAYEGRLVPKRAPFDEYAKALREDREASDALGEPARSGLRLFVGKANCVSCHDGPRFTDDGFHNLGVPAREGASPLGRRKGAADVLADEFNCRGPWSDAPASCDELEHLDPAFADFEGAFRTPSLRNVARTAPYMNAGQLATLADVVTFYSDLPGTAAVGHREATLKPLHLSDSEKRSLVAFLESLTGAPQPAELLVAP